jgi:hypothetical protein
MKNRDGQGGEGIEVTKVEDDRLEEDKEGKGEMGEWHK